MTVAIEQSQHAVDEAAERERVAAIMDGNPDAIFVFGSNRAGLHGGGAALHAQRFYGAKLFRGEGVWDRSYALPTKDKNIHTLPLDEIGKHVDAFIEFARKHPRKTFAVTRVGCGLAGLTDEQMAPMFAGAPDNCKLPPIWVAIINNSQLPKEPSR